MQQHFQQKLMDFHSDKPVEVARFTFWKSKVGNRLFQVIDEGFQEIPGSSETIKYLWLKEYVNGQPEKAIQVNEDTFINQIKTGLLINTGVKGD